MPTLPQKIAFLLIVLLLVGACDVRQESPVPNAQDMLDEARQLYDEGSYEKAEDRFAAVLPLLRSDSNLRSVASVYSTLGRIAFRAGRYRRALSQVDSAIAACVDARDYRQEATQWLLKGDFLTELSDYKAAQEAYGRALSLSSAFNDRREKNRTLLRLGRASLLEGRLHDAQETFEQALTISIEDGVKSETSAGLTGVAQVYFAQGRFEESASTFAQARDASEGGADALAQIRLGLVRALRALGDQAGALEAISEGTRDEEEAMGGAAGVLLSFERSLVAQEGKRFEQAFEAMDAAIRRAEEIGDQIALNYLALFRIQLTEQSLDASDRSSRMASLIGQYAEVADAFALIDNRTGEAYARIRKAQLLRRMNQLEESRTEYRLALAVEDTRLGEYVNPDRHLPFLQELGLGAVREHWYRDFATLCVQMNDLDQAMAVMERARLKRQFIVLRQEPPRLQISEVQEKVDTVDGLIRYMTSLQREISGMLARRPLSVLPQHVGELKKELKELQSRAIALSAEIADEMPNYAPVVYLGYAPTLNLKSLTPQGTALVQYLPGEEELLILLQTGRKLELRRSPIGRKKLADLLGEYLRLMQDPIVYAGSGGEASIEPMLRFAILSPELYTLLLKPIEPFYGERLIVVPDGMFEGFPLHALEQQGSSGEIRFLIELVGIEYVPSLTSLRYRSIEPRPVRSVTGIGNPTGRDWSIDYELRDLRSFFKDAAIFTGLEATWSRLKTASPDLLFLSTEFLNSVPDISLGSIGLSDGVTSGELVYVPFARVVELRAASAVVLSNHHEGGAGLRPDHANLMRLRGNPDVFLNAWPADRKAAKFFSEFFVTHIANGLRPAEAYRQALLNLIRIREVHHPRSWGQFFYFGGL